MISAEKENSTSLTEMFMKEISLKENSKVSEDIFSTKTEIIILENGNPINITEKEFTETLMEKFLNLENSLKIN